jgi:RNA polymerase sigma-70 factor (ECF subfamily)
VVSELSSPVREELERCLEDRLPALYYMALALLGRPDQAEDAVQEAALRAVSSLHTFRSEADICTWVHRIVINRCNDHLNRRTREASHLSDRAIDELWEDPSYSIDPALVVQNLDTREKLTEALDRLRPQQRAVVVMHDSHGWKLQEIADAFAIPLSTAKSHLRRGRQTLVTLLGEERLCGAS